MPTVRHHDPGREKNDTGIPGVREQGSRDIGSPACGSRGISVRIISVGAARFFRG